MRRSVRRLGVLAAVTTLVLAGCGRDDGGSEAEGEATLGTGVTSEPCPDAVDESKGCIYLGIISDLTGVFAGVGVPLTDGGQAFWKRVNEEGGIGDYEVDVTTYVKDNKYDPRHPRRGLRRDQRRGPPDRPVARDHRHRGDAA